VHRRAGGQVGGQDQLRSLGADHGLGIVGLTEFVGVGAAHQGAVGVGEVGLPRGWRIILGRLGRAAAPALLGVIDGFLGFVLRPGRSFGAVPRTGAGLGLEPGAGGIQLGLQRLAPGDLGRQRLRVGLGFGIGCIRAGGQRGDVGGEPGAQFLRAVVAHRADLGGVGIDLRPVDRHHPEPQEAALARQQQHGQKGLLEGSAVGAAEGGNRIVVRVQVRCHVAHTKVAIRRPLDPT
jgi:hypothetical protein